VYIRSHERIFCLSLRKVNLLFSLAENLKLYNITAGSPSSTITLQKTNLSAIRLASPLIWVEVNIRCQVNRRKRVYKVTLSAA